MKITKDFGFQGSKQTAEFDNNEMKQAFSQSGQHIGTMTDILHRAHPEYSRGLCAAAVEQYFFVGDSER